MICSTNRDSVLEKDRSFLSDGGGEFESVSRDFWEWKISIFFFFFWEMCIIHLMTVLVISVNWDLGL